jgi:alpha-L-fucosidase
MKKVLAIVLALALVLGLTSAVAESKGMIYGIYKAGDQTWFIDEGAAAEKGRQGRRV